MPLALSSGPARLSPDRLARLASAVNPEKLEMFPLSSALYAQLGEGGRKLQAEFEHRLQTSLAGLQMEAGKGLLVIPAHNESKDIQGTLDSVLHGLQGDPCVKEAVVVDNRSTDDTQAQIREWASRHAANIRFVEGTAPLPPTTDGRPTIRLISEEKPGKTSALLSVRGLFEASGKFPEWMVQLDADTWLSEHAAGTLIRDSTADGEVATGGRHRPRLRDGRIPFEKVNFAPFRDDTIPGGFLAARTPVWVAGLEAIHARYPQAITEDKLFTALLKTAGFKIGGKNPRAPVQTLAPTELSDFRQRNARFLAGDHQAEGLYGADVLREIGLKRTWETEVSERAGDWAQWAQSPRDVFESAATAVSAAASSLLENPSDPARKLWNAARTVLGDPTGTALTAYDIGRSAVPYALAIRDAGGIAAKAEGKAVFSWEPVR